MNHPLISQDSCPFRPSLLLSLCLTGAVAATVCTPPHSLLQSWPQLFARATAYLLAAALAHTIAVWGASRLPRERRAKIPSRRIAPLALLLWSAIVWLPLLALLTSEHSPWVAFVLPLTAIFTTLVLLSQRRPHEAPEPAHTPTHELLHLPEEQPLWRRLLPALLASIALQIGIEILATGRAWIAGLLFAVAAAYVAQRYLTRSLPTAGPRSTARTSAGNSLTVWTLLALALTPFLVIVGGRMAGLLGILHTAHAATRFGAPVVSRRAASGYTGIILLRPHKPHEIVVPHPAPTPATAASPSRPQVIQFDGAYWYFQAPDTRPAPGSRVAHGDPLKNHIRSTDNLPLIIEAHQPLPKPVPMSCCRSLRVDVINADAVPGAITLQVLLREPAPGKPNTLYLAPLMLPSSTVIPMPLHRAPVHETLTFPLPPTARHKSFDEITIRIKPDLRRSLAAPHVSIEQFVLTP